jgi:hypothetical protein
MQHMFEEVQTDSMPQCRHAGDLEGVRAALRQGCEVNGLIDLQNQNNHYVVGVSPLYIAAQGGHTKMCELLIKAGADVLQQCCIPATGEVFGPVDIALVHFHMGTWWYLSARRQQLQSKVNGASGFSWSALRSQPAMAATNLVEPLISSHVTI